MAAPASPETKDTPAETKRGQVCRVCKAPNAKSCSGCRTVFYCSTDCQRNDRLAHKEFCKKTAAQPQLPLPPVAPTTTTTTTKGEEEKKNPPNWGKVSADGKRMHPLTIVERPPTTDWNDVVITTGQLWDSFYETDAMTPPMQADLKKQIETRIGMDGRTHLCHAAGCTRVARAPMMIMNTDGSFHATVYCEDLDCRAILQDRLAASAGIGQLPSADHIYRKCCLRRCGRTIKESTAHKHTNGGLYCNQACLSLFILEEEVAKLIPARQLQQKKTNMWFAVVELFILAVIWKISLPTAVEMPCAHNSKRVHQVKVATHIFSYVCRSFWNIGWLYPIVFASVKYAQIKLVDVPLVDGAPHLANKTISEIGKRVYIKMAVATLYGAYRLSSYADLLNTIPRLGSVASGLLWRVWIFIGLCHLYIFLFRFRLNWRSAHNNAPYTVSKVVFLAAFLLLVFTWLAVEYLFPSAFPVFYFCIVYVPLVSESKRGDAIHLDGISILLDPPLFVADLLHKPFTVWVFYSFANSLKSTWVPATNRFLPPASPLRQVPQFCAGVLSRADVAERVYETVESVLSDNHTRDGESAISRMISSLADTPVPLALHHHELKDYAHGWNFRPVRPLIPHDVPTAEAIVRQFTTTDFSNIKSEETRARYGSNKGRSASPAVALQLCDANGAPVAMQVPITGATLCRYKQTGALHVVYPTKACRIPEVAQEKIYDRAAEGELFDDTADDNKEAEAERLACARVLAANVKWLRTHLGDCAGADLFKSDIGYGVPIRRANAICAHCFATEPEIMDIGNQGPPENYVRSKGTKALLISCHVFWVPGRGPVLDRPEEDVDPHTPLGLHFVVADDNLDTRFDIAKTVSASRNTFPDNTLFVFGKILPDKIEYQ